MTRLDMPNVFQHRAAGHGALRALFYHETCNTGGFFVGSQVGRNMFTIMSKDLSGWVALPSLV